MEFEKEFNRKNYETAFFDDTLRYNSGGRYCIDTSFVFAAVGIADWLPNFLTQKKYSINGYYKDWREKFEKVFSFPITIPQPILGEIYNQHINHKIPDGNMKRIKELFDRKNVRFLITEDLSPKNWKPTMTRLMPEVMKTLAVYMQPYNHLSGILSDEDASVLVLSKYENQILLTIDLGMLNIAFRHDCPHFDFWKERKLPDKPAPKLEIREINEQ